MRPFRQSTVVTIRIGPALDADGLEYTGLVIGDLTLTKAGTSAAMAAAATLTHVANGMYSLVTIAGNTDTVGSLRIDCTKAGYQIPVVEGYVIEEPIFDALFAASANAWTGAAGSSIGTANVTQLGGDAQSATDLKDFADAGYDPATNKVEGVKLADTLTTYTNNTPQTGDAYAVVNHGTHGNAAIKTETAAILDDTDLIDDGTSGLAKIATDVAAILVDTGTTLDGKINTIDTVVDAIKAITDRLGGLSLANGTIGDTGNSTTALHLEGLTYGDDELNDYLLVILDVSTSEYHARWIEDWADTGDLATVATLPFTPQNDTDTYWILPIRQDVSGGSGLDAAGVRAAVGLASANLDTQLGTIDTVADRIEVDTQDIQSRIPAALGANGNIKADVRDYNGTAGTFSGGRPEVNVSHLGGSATPVTNMTTVFSTDFASNYNTTADRWKVDATHWLGTDIPAPSLAGIPSVDMSALVGSVPRAIDLHNVFDGTTIKTFDALNNLSSAQAQAAAAAALTAFGKTGYALASDGLDLIIPADPSAIPVLGTSSIVTWIGYFGAWTVNEVNSDSDSVNLRNSADSADLATHTTSDNGSVFSSSEPA